MPTKIVVPELGESVVEATVGQWRKHEGDRVGVGDVLVELETEKVDLEVGAEHSGVLAKIERKEGENVRIGDVLGVIEEASAQVQESSKSQDAKPTNGKQRQPQAQPESPVQSPEAPSVESKKSESKKEEETAPAKRWATPLAKRVAEEHGVDLSLVPSAEEGGRVRQRDVESYLQSHAEEKPTLVAPAAQAPAAAEARGQTAPQPAPAGSPAERQRFEERVRMSRRRQTIARRLVEAQRTAAMLTTFNEIDMSAVMQLRERWKEHFKNQYGVGLGVVSFFVKASIAALRQFPRLNAEVQETEMVLKHYYDIGVAVGAPEGLVVPVLRDADRMGFPEIEKAIKELARKSQAGELTLEDLRGGTFTISNGGVFGSLLSTPILNPPQVGILGLHKVEKRAVPIGEKIEVRPMMYVALSYDHRIVDGMEAVQFLVRVKELVEDPASMLFTV